MAAEDTAEKLLAAMSRHDLKAFAAHYTADAVAHDPFYPQPLKGQAAIRKDFENFVKAFPDLQFKASNIMAKGRTVLVEATMSGTHKGPLAAPTGTVPPTNRRIEGSGAFVMRVNPKGLIVEERRYFDTGGFMQQLGLTQ